MASEGTELSSDVVASARESTNEGQTAANSHQTSDKLNDSERASVVSHEDIDRCGSSETKGAASTGKVVFRTPDESIENVQELVKRPHLPEIPKKKDRSASLLSGSDLENFADSRSSGFTPPTSTISISSYDLRNRKQSKLVYDVKYHPMDDTIRPSQAAKRRTAHGEAPIVDFDDSSDAFTLNDTTAITGESSGAQSEGDEETPSQSKQARGRKQAQSRPLPAEGTRRSTRKVSDQKTSYNMDIHPQDKYLVISSDDDDGQSRSNKRKEITRKRPTASDDSDPDIRMAKKPRVSRQKRSYRTVPSTSDTLDSSDMPVSHNVDTDEASKHTNNTTKPSHPPIANSLPDHGIRRREGIDVWHYPPGKRYLNHDRNYWPTLPDQTFAIFHEKLEDQLAREAMEASPLNYEHDDKENISNADIEPGSDDYGGISVMPSAQYLQSSDEQQLADHRALVSEALYSDEAPQSYGLDGTHGTCEAQKNNPAEYMNILVSGENLPPGPTHVEAQAETQDSVLDSDYASEI
ncbi:hypothetical protein ACET3X_003034 [Alternaria dauci]|uniref:Uncharacterized protein n=1 Tax=Alternaria dauci TaxID=48095 RepID=A0ABR3URA4_9PLEO